MSDISTKDPKQIYGYTVSLKIITPQGTIDIPSNNIGSIKIIQSLAFYCTMVRMDLLVDPSIFVEYKLDGRETYKITLTKVTSDKNVLDVVTYDLMSMSTSVGVPSVPTLPNKPFSNQRPALMNIPLRLMDLNAAKIIHKNIKGIFNGKNIESIINDLVKTAKSETKLTVEISGFDNQEVYPQLLIPLQNFTSALRYISKNFTCYNMPAFFFIDQEKITLSAPHKFKKLRAPVIVTQLSDQTKAVNKPKQYYTGSGIEVTHSANATSVKTGKTIKSIQYGHNKFFSQVTHDLQTMVDDSKFAGKNSKLDYKSFLNSVRVIDNQNTSSTHATSTAGEDLYGNVKTGISIGFTRNLIMKDFLPMQYIKLEVQKVNNIEYAGDYFIYTTVFDFKKESIAWVPTIHLSLMRIGIGI